MADKPIARVGDMHVCPAHGANAIVTGASSVLVNGKPVARVGDKTACGAGILTGAVSFFGQGSMVAYMGSTTSHGGLITTGSPDTFVGVEIVAVDNIAVHRTAGSEINDPPLEGVPILPVEELAQVVKEIVETLQEQELSFAVVGSVAADVVLRKVEKVIPVKQIKKEIEAFGERALAKYKALTGKATHPDFNRRYHGPDDLLKNKNNRLEEVEVKAT
ncbi:MAG: PAAR domain-containing protein, partial [Methylococcaceae bacterium]